MSRAAVTTNEDPPTSIYVANADTAFQSFTKVQNPFEQGEIHGMVHLEGQPTSSGAYVNVGNSNHCAAADGSSHFLVPGGNYELLIQSPGYVPVRISVTTINPVKLSASRN